MNRGEGLRNAAKAKSGGLGGYFNEPKTKPKKFGYKSRTQQFSVRKNVDNVIIEDNRDKLSKTTGSKPREQPRNPRPLQQKATNKQQTSTNPKRQGKDQQQDNAKTSFIDKNKKVGGKSTRGADTVTLTQDQLNAILKTIDSAGKSAGNPSFSIDAGELKLNLNPRKNEDNVEQRRAAENVTDTGADNHEENVIEANSHDQESKQNNSGDRNNNDPAVRKDGAQEQERKADISKSVSTSQELTGTPRGNQADILNTIGTSEQNDKALQEKKKQQWKRELDEQLAAKRALQEKDGKNRRRSGQNSSAAEEWSPWGQPGAGAPMVKGHRNGPVQSPRENKVTAGPASPERSSRGQSQGSSDGLSQSISGLGYIERQQQYVPAAMRSSFIIGGSAGKRTESHNVDVKRREKEEWLRDLEKQKREAQEKKDREKANQRRVDSAVMQHWAEPVDVPPPHRASRMDARADTRVAQVQDDIGVRSGPATERNDQIEQPKSAPLRSTRSPRPSDDDSPRMHIRPANTLIDPAELERRELQKKKHLEHIEAVKAQVEEKQRKKREELERRRAEEAEEERRLAEERDRLAQDFEHERQKQMKKEAAAAAKQKALAQGMQDAYEEAMRIKQRERLSKLQQHGHDVSNLRKSWDNDKQSPRLPTNQHQHHHQPQQEQPPPVATTSVQFSPRRDQGQHSEAVASQVARDVPPIPVGIHDMATSPIHEVSTQTEHGVLSSDYISPRLIEAIRLASAGAEYKPTGSKHRAGKGRDDGGERRKEKTVKIATVREDEIENKRGKTSRKNSNAEKPKWGQVASKKRMMKNSDKDMSMSKQKREERLRKRQEEMLALQEKNAPKRATQARQKRVEEKAVESERPGRRSGMDTKLSHRAEDASKPPQDRSRSRKEEASKRHDGARSNQGHGQRVTRPSSSEDSYRGLPETPPLKNGDFVPFMRTEDELNAANVSVSPSPPMQLSQDQPHRQQVTTETAATATRGDVGSTSRQSRQSHREMDPLLNPDRLKDKEHRQEQILLQLSNLRQGLLMKQRELEIGLPPSSPGIM